MSTSRDRQCPQCLTHSSATPKCAHPFSGSPTPPVPRGSIPPAPPLEGSIALPARPHCLGSAPASTYLGGHQSLELQPQEHLPERHH